MYEWILSLLLRDRGITILFFLRDFYEEVFVAFCLSACGNEADKANEAEQVSEENSKGGEKVSDEDKKDESA